MARPVPADNEIIDALVLHHRDGFPIKKSAAVEIVRIHFGTTTKKADEWLDELTGRDEPVLLDVWASSYGLSSVLRPNPDAATTRYRRIHKRLEQLGYGVTQVYVDEDAKFVGRSTRAISEQSWIMPPSMLTELTKKQLAADSEQRNQARQEAHAKAEAFEAKHPQAVDRIRAALDGVITDVDLHTGVLGSGRTTLSLTVVDDDIDRFAALLRKASESPSTQE